ncbi:MAG: nitroreductase family protein [Chitinivibrionales bacterium]|nr:nitroreductase family protein [Chitinivibrionales bacterium]
MPKISIDEKLCTKCNTCVTACVLGIIEKSSDSTFPAISTENEGNCLRCGHCEAFCSREALVLDSLPGEKIRIKPHDGVIEPQRLSLYMKKRRSIRHFSLKAVAKDLVTQIIDVARYAPTGGNQQPVQWLVLYDTAEVKRIAGLTVDWMRSIQNTSHPLSPYTSGIIAMWDNGVDYICHDAPHLIFTHIPHHDTATDPTDAVIAMTHFDIAAPSFGIGTCWAGFVKMAADSHKPLQDALSLPEGRKAACAMMFGYPLYRVAAIPGRNAAEIAWR